MTIKSSPIKALTRLLFLRVQVCLYSYLLILLDYSCTPTLRTGFGVFWLAPSTFSHYCILSLGADWADLRCSGVVSGSGEAKSVVAGAGRELEVEPLVGRGVARRVGPAALQLLERGAQPVQIAVGRVEHREPGDLGLDRHPHLDQ